MNAVTLLREAQNLSQAELARRAGLNASTVCMIERNRLIPYPSQAEKLALVLGCDADQLLKVFETQALGRI